jgi:short-subunit dehydrogenase
MKIEGKRLLLSGATGGLGRAIAGELAGRGATLVLSARRQAELERLADELPGEHETSAADLAQPGAGARLVRDAGRLDGMIANAAGVPTGRLERFSAEELEQALRVNLEAPLQMARELLPSLTERGEGHLVFVSSLNARAATPRTSLYVATKTGLRGFALSLRADLVGRGIGVSVISPGFIRDAGMFHESGARASPILGTSTSGAVARAVARAIERDIAELTVAPLRQRALSNFALVAPRIAARVLAGRAAARSADEVHAGHLRSGKASSR